MTSVPERTAPTRPRGFDVLRLFAAGLVLVSHGFLLPTASEPYPIVFGDYAFTYGRLAVIVFFIVSGYLICASWNADPDARSFFRKRFRRLYPALGVMIVLATFMLGPIITTVDSYFTRAGTWAFVGGNLSVLAYQYQLPGVFEANPLAEVNGVMWTLGIEVVAYVLIGIAGWLGLLRRPYAVFAAAVALAVVSWAWLADEIGLHDGVAVRLRLLAYFAAGAAVSTIAWRPSWRAAAASAAVLSLLVWLRAPLSVALIPLGTVIILYLGTRTWEGARRVTDLGDPSYGVYIYGFLVQQLLVAYGFRDASRAAFIAVSILVTFAVGYASWHLVEKRFLPHRPARRTPRRARVVPADGDVAPDIASEGGVATLRSRISPSAFAGRSLGRTASEPGVKTS